MDAERRKRLWDVLHKRGLSWDEAEGLRADHEAQVAEVETLKARIAALEEERDNIVSHANDVERGIMLAREQVNRLGTIAQEAALQAQRARDEALEEVDAVLRVEMERHAARLMVGPGMAIAEARERIRTLKRGAGASDGACRVDA